MTMRRILLCFIVIFVLKVYLTCANDDVYRIGFGIADITGPTAEINMMGYAKSGQDTSGIHLRLYSRAVVIEDQRGSRICYISCDLAMVSQVVKLEAIKLLQQRYNGLYTQDNVMISGTHTHSGPGGFLQYVLYIITAQGFVPQSFAAIVNGIIKSVDNAHNNMTSGYIYWNSGELLDTSINRSPTAYSNNPEEEKAKYKYNTDKEMSLLKMTDLNGQPLGVVNWFAVHATSMNNTNKLVSGDNKGYASMLFEQDVNGGTLHGKGPFVALFSQSNEGDVSPNTRGPHCTDTGLECDIATSTCNGQRRRNNPAINKNYPEFSYSIPRNEKCVASGPGIDMFESTKIIGQKQYEKAKQLFNDANTKITGPIKFIHQTIDMSNVAIVTANNITLRTCKPAMGYSFAAGTTDGPGAFDFRQGETSSSPFWNLVRDFIQKPSSELIECQFPKPILLATGEMKFPYQWEPTILPTQIFQIGNFVILAVPAEFTTMSGRRLKQAVKFEYDRLTPNNTIKIAISGLANAYSSYVTTFEEYQVQRYEAASTLFGPHTLLAYIHQFQMLASHLITNQQPLPGPPEPNLLNKQISLKPGVIYDGTPMGHRFGDVICDAKSEYSPGSTVVVCFVSGNPRNDLQLEGTFLTVERFDNRTSSWQLIATDANWETKFIWKRTNTFFGESRAYIVWDIPQNVQQGYYRIRHFGHSRNILQNVKSYVGTSSVFKVVHDPINAFQRSNFPSSK